MTESRTLKLKICNLIKYYNPKVWDNYKKMAKQQNEHKKKELEGEE